MKCLFGNVLSTSLLIVVTLFIGSQYYHYSPLYKSVTRAIAVLHSTKGNEVSGVVMFTQKRDGMLVKATVHGLTPGAHGFHIHEYGDCACDDAVCAGNHFNPTHKMHGAVDALNRHMGDLGNLIANADGNAEYIYTDTKIKLNGPYSIIGRAVIVHADQDDYVSQPTGNAGVRVACGVIGLSAQL